MAEELNAGGAYLVLNAIPNIGPITTNRLLQKFDGDPIRIFSASAHELESVNGVGPVISYVRQIGNTQLLAEFKWLPELDTDHRMEGDYLWFKLGLLF